MKYATFLLLLAMFSYTSHRIDEVTYFKYTVDFKDTTAMIHEALRSLDS